MRKLVILLVFLSLLSQTAKAEIRYEINKYGVMIVTFVITENDTLTTDLLRSDWQKAIQIATTKDKLKQIQFKDKKGKVIGWADRNKLSTLNNVLEKLIADFSTFDVVEKVYGDSVRTSWREPAQYHSDTYCNGKLISEYSADWTQGYFPEKSSTYKSGGNTYTTRVYYTPARQRYEWSRPVKGNKVIEKGETIKLKEIYKIIF